MSPYYWQRGKYWIKFDRLTIDPDSWAGIQQSVRKGEASARFDIGDEFISTYNGNEMSWQVIGIDQDTPVDEEYTHSLTLQSKEVLENIYFDNTTMRYTLSSLRTYLNNSENGFLTKIDHQLANILGEVEKRVAVSPIYENGNQDIFNNKVFIPSLTEIGGNDSSSPGSIEGEFCYIYYISGTNFFRIRENPFSLTTSFYWLRSPSSNGIRLNKIDDGALGYFAATPNKIFISIAPILTII